MGLKGQLTDNFSMSVAIFNMEYKGLLFQVSITSEGGFDTSNLVIE